VCFADPQRRERYFDVYSENVILHGYSGVEPGFESFRRYYAGVWSVFPDARVIAEDLIETDDKVFFASQWWARTPSHFSGSRRLDGLPEFQG
jgi:hypothetical protein